MRAGLTADLYHPPPANDQPRFPFTPARSRNRAGSTPGLKAHGFLGMTAKLRCRGCTCTVVQGGSTVKKLIFLNHVKGEGELKPRKLGIFKKNHNYTRENGDSGGEGGFEPEHMMHF